MTSPSEKRTNCMDCGAALTKSEADHRAKRCRPCCRIERRRSQRASRLKNPRVVPLRLIQCRDCGAMIMRNWMGDRCAGCICLRPQTDKRGKGHYYVAECVDCSAPIIVTNRVDPPPRTRCDKCQKRRLRTANAHWRDRNREMYKEYFRWVRQQPDRREKLLLKAKQAREEIKRDPIRWAQQRANARQWRARRKKVLDHILENPEIVMKYILQEAEHGSRNS